MKLLIVLLLLSSIPVSLMGLISAYYSSNIIYSHASKSNQILLKQVENDINGVLQKIDDLLVQYTNYNNTIPNNLNRYVQRDLNVENRDLVNELSEVLTNLQSGMNHVLELDFYSIPFRKVLSSKGDLYTDATYPDQAALQEARKPALFGTWMHTRPVQLSGGGKKFAITLIRNVAKSQGNLQAAEGAIIVYLDAVSLGYRLAALTESTPISLFLVNPDGYIITHSDPSRIGTYLGDRLLLQRLGGLQTGTFHQFKWTPAESKALDVSVIPSSNRNWYYVLSTPEQLLAQQPKQARNIMLGISACLLLLAAVLAFRFSHNLYNPLRQLMKRLSKGEPVSPRQDEVAVIGDYMESMDRKNRELTQSLRKYSEQAESFALHQLLIGSIRAADIAGDIRFASRSSMISVLLIEIDQRGFADMFSLNDQYLFYFCVDNITNELLQPYGDTKIFMIQPGLFAVLLASEQAYSPDRLREAGEQIRNALSTYLKLTAFISVAYTSEGLSELTETYQSALASQRYRFFVGDQRVLMPDDLDPNAAFQADELYRMEEEPSFGSNSFFMTSLRLLEDMRNI